MKHAGIFVKKMNNHIPKFKTEDEEREFWASHSPLDYFDATQFKRALFPRRSVCPGKPGLTLVPMRPRGNEQR